MPQIRFFKNLPKSDVKKLVESKDVKNITFSSQVLGAFLDIRITKAEAKRLLAQIDERAVAKTLILTEDGELRI